MNIKAEELINKIKEEQKSQREEHLISLGLVDKSRKHTKRVYIDKYASGAKLDSSKNQYYFESEEFAAIEVTDEEYREILKHFPLPDNKNTDKTETRWANIINRVANILIPINLVIGIVMWFILDDSYITRKMALIPMFAAIAYCVLFYPLIIGFSKIVAVAEKRLKE